MAWEWRKDLFELLYGRWYLRPVLKMYLKVKQFIKGNVRSKIENNIHMETPDTLKILNSGAQPHAEFILRIDNRNHSSLRINGYNIVLSFSGHSSYFENLFWDGNAISAPPPNVTINEIEGQDTGALQIDLMLPYYVYFTEKDRPIFLSGTIKFDTDVGEVEHEFVHSTTLRRYDLWNRTDAQGRLMESFHPGELDRELR